MGINTSAIENPSVSDEVFATQVRVIQRKLRWWLYRRHAAAQKLQAAARGMLVRRTLKRLRDSALLIQSFVRTRKAKREFQKLKQVTIQLQSHYRATHGAKRTFGANSSTNAAIMQTGSAAASSAASHFASNGMSSFGTGDNSSYSGDKHRFDSSDRLSVDAYTEPVMVSGEKTTADLPASSLPFVPAPGLGETHYYSADADQQM